MKKVVFIATLLITLGLATCFAEPTGISQQSEKYVMPTPEPTTMLLMGIGLAGIAAAKKFRSKK